MRDLFNQLLGYVHGVWRYKWFMMAVAWLVTVIGWTIVFQIPHQYESTAKVYVDTRTILRPLLKGMAIQPNVNQQVKLMTRLLMTRPNMEKLARMTDLDLNAQTPEQMRSLVDSLKAKISIKPASRSDRNLYKITGRYDDPQTAKEIVQAFMTIFVESTLGESRKDTDNAQRFLDEQIADHEKRLQEAEVALAQFKSRNLGMMPGEGGGYYENLQKTASQLREAKLQLSESIRRRDELRDQLEEEEESLDSMDGMVGETQYDARILALQGMMDELLLRFTDEHPDVLAIQDTINELEGLRQRDLQESESSQGLSGGSLNPVYQQMRLSLGEAEANTASLQARVQEYAQRIDELKLKVDETLAVETRLQSLNRDYNIVRKNYNMLLQRREKARMSEQVDEKADTVNFRIIESPHAPRSPSQPNRFMLSTIVLVMGIAAGIGLAFFMSLLRPTFHDQRTLGAATSVPVLGGLSMFWDPEQQAKHRTALGVYVLTGFGLLTMYSSLMMVEYLDISIIDQFTSLKDKLL